MSSAIFFLALPSLIVFGLLVRHLDANLGRKKAVLYFAGLFVYGWIRAAWLQHITKDDLGSAFPYLINLPVFKLGGASLQEIIGWSVAATLAWLISDRLLRRFGLHPGPHRTALGAAFVLCAICLAVETAAIEAGWWQWTLTLPQRGLFGRVPLVGLLDWGFVAFDFLLPFLLLIVPAPWSQRIPALLLYVLHFRFHTALTVLPEPAPLKPNDLMHGAIFAYVIIRSLGERGIAAFPEPEKEKYRKLPLLAAGIIALATSLSNILVAHHVAGVLASIPLLAMALGAYAWPLPVKQPVEKKTEPQKKKGRKQEEAPPPAAQPASWGMFGARIAVVVGVFLLLYALRVPLYRRTAVFLDHLKAASVMMNNKQWSDAEAELQKGVEIRPEHPGGHVMLAQVLLLQDKREQARAELNTALTLNATDVSALVLMSILELKEQHWAEASERAATGVRVYPDRIEFEYLAALAATKGPAATAAPEVQAVVTRARSAGLPTMQSLVLPARNLNDTATIALLMQKMK